MIENTRMHITCSTPEQASPVHYWNLEHSEESIEEPNRFLSWEAEEVCILQDIRFTGQVQRIRYLQVHLMHPQKKLLWLVKNRPTRTDQKIEFSPINIHPGDWIMVSLRPLDPPMIEPPTPEDLAPIRRETDWIYRGVCFILGVLLGYSL